MTWDWKGHQIQYTVQGTGRPLVLIHGFGASIGHWRKNIPVLAEAGYQVFALDLLGFGGSAKPAIAYTVELWTDLIKDFWSAKIGQPAYFIGNSIGGLLCLMVLADYPDIAAGGILLNPAGGLNHRPDELNLPLRLVMGTFTKLVSSKTFGSWLFDRVRQKARIRSSLQQVYRDRDAITDELVELLYTPSCDPGAQKVFSTILTAPAGPKPTDLLPRIQKPLLVVWGEADPWTPIAGAAIYQGLTASHDVKFAAIPDTGHCPHDERPDVVNPLILKWLAER
ncbi:alpha/beta fold hydrolase [Myxacorys almedinensis A]|uniref:Alpha/beta fold hydrolase n=2 Tax=Myxacorys TaxID=2056239 RepID=A0A8J8CJW1_9CYAN|nr:alpha/beta fold hydrolase [Myxacorys almedinensis]NDJ17991.1 alpha/beta fold hydrolase [Myxacorys almedinensis A]